MRYVPLLLLLAFLGGAAAWGTTGHYVVADIAWALMDASSRATVTHYFGNVTMGGASSLADVYRSTKQGAWSAPLHYCDMPENVTEFVYPQYCPNPPGCVLRAVYNYTSRLTKEGADGAYCKSVQNYTIEPCALEFLTHFIGDIHQPLHVGYLEDLGGNLVTVKWYNKTTNLHSVWDSSIIDQAVSLYYQGNQSILSLELLGEIIYGGEALLEAYRQHLDPFVWASESFQLTRTVVYDFYSNTTPPVLGDAYFAANWPVVRARLTAAGVRLYLTVSNSFAPPPLFKRPWAIALLVVLCALVVLTVLLILWRVSHRTRYVRVADIATQGPGDESLAILSARTP